MSHATDSATRTRTHQMIFVNLPVADTERSREFFAALGYAFNEEMCQAGTALALELGPNLYAMLLQRDFFDQFHRATSAQPGQHEVLTCLSAENREAVDDLVDRAIAAGGTQLRDEQGGDFMYGRSYADLDGHIWEIMWMDVEKARAAEVFG